VMPPPRGLRAVGSRRPCLDVPQTAVRGGDWRSIMVSRRGAGELCQRPLTGGARVLPKLAVRIFVPFIFLLPKWPAKA
jgi:hypothetical protein